MQSRKVDQSRSGLAHNFSFTTFRTIKFYTLARFKSLSDPDFTCESDSKFSLSLISNNKV